MKFFYRIGFFLFFLSCGLLVRGQGIDSLPPADSSTVDTLLKQVTPAVADTLVSKFSKPLIVIRPWSAEEGTPLVWQIMQRQPFFSFGKQPVFLPQSNLRNVLGKEVFFYVLMGLVLIFALLKLAFDRYLGDLRRLFFRTTLKQKQIRDQMTQSPLPSLLFNGFFVAVAGFYVALLFYHLRLDIPVDNFWLMVVYTAAGLIAVYAVKYIGLKIMGWLFNLRQLTDAYIFIVFLVNKVLGIFLLPMIVLLAFTRNDLNTVCWIISWCGIGLLYLYRYILAWGAVRNQVRVNVFHFFLYFCAFEVAPLLLIYRSLLFVFK